MEDETLADVQSEMRFIGTLFINSDLFLEYEKVVRWDYYFSDIVCKTIYRWLEDLYAKEQKFNEKNLTVYASQNEERLSFFKKIGGFETIKEFINLSDESEFKSYFNSIQKWTLVRELQLKGVDTSAIRASKGFERANSNQVYNQLKKMLDTIHTKVTADIEVISLTVNVEKMAEGFLEKPSMGTPTFIENFNQSFRGFHQGSFFCFGTPTNQGKSRYMVKTAAYHSIIEKQKVLLMLNEMRSDELKLALLVTCINNIEFKKVHGIDTSINEKDLSLGLYKDEEGRHIYRKLDSGGNFLETIPEFRKRLLKTSSQFRNVMLVSKWVEENTKEDTLSVIDVASDYSDASLETIARKNARKGFQMIAYDNLKSHKESVGDYSGLIKTTTMLSEVAKQEKIFMYGSIQLTPDSLRTDMLELSSMNIQSAKGLKDVLDMLVLSKEIDRELYTKYRYFPNMSNLMGQGSNQALALTDKGYNWKYYGLAIDKNRLGSKEVVLAEVNLNTNEWYERGILTR